MENTAFQFHRGDYDYQASSPDEKALAEACQRLISFSYVKMFTRPNDHVN